MKKAIYIFAMISLFSLAISPALAITTSLTPDTSGGAKPIVQVKWEANIDGYTDALPEAGAQFSASGHYQENKTIRICAIVSDPDGLADVKHVYADVFYPEGIAVGDSHVKLPSQTGDDDAGCGVLMQEDELLPLTKADGLALFCGATNSVKASNFNLPKFYDGYSYDAICRADGYLQKETARVYCINKEISYEDPSGSYDVKAVVVDRSGKQSILDNHFTYLPTTAFEADFNNVSYGNVRLETEKLVSGNLAFAPTTTPVVDNYPSTMPTIRNVGNTRLAMTIEQDDMDFGKTGLLWNVEYKTRVGNDETDWVTYDPEEEVTLGDELDLSELDEVDFSIFVKKFPITEKVYAGEMTLGADFVSHLTDCSYVD